jgi:hypothetical protein
VPTTNSLGSGLAWRRYFEFVCLHKCELTYVRIGPLSQHRKENTRESWQAFSFFKLNLYKILIQGTK